MGSPTILILITTTIPQGIVVININRIVGTHSMVTVTTPSCSIHYHDRSPLTWKALPWLAETCYRGSGEHETIVVTGKKLHQQ